MMPFFAQGKLPRDRLRLPPGGVVADAHEYMSKNRNFGKILLAVNRSFSPADDKTLFDVESGLSGGRGVL
jgi:hypothetical protein